MKVEDCHVINTYSITLRDGVLQQDDNVKHLLSAGLVVVPARAWAIVTEARRDGWYEDHGGWDELDKLISTTTPTV